MTPPPATLASTRSTRTRRRIAAGAALAILPMVGAALATAPAAHADSATTRATASPKIDGTYVFSGPTKVKTTSKKKLEVSVSANRSTSTNNTNLSVRVATRNGVESHTWNFELPKKALKLTKAGKGKLVSGSKMGPFGKLTLNVIPTSKAKTTKCGSTPLGKSRKAVVAGKFFFNTKSTGAKKWGAMGSRKRAFTFSTGSTVGWSYVVPDGVELRCGDTSFCPTGLSWSVFETGADFVSGDSRDGKFWVTGSRTAKLSKPKKAQRFDFVSVKEPAPTLTVAPDNNATMVVRGSSGTATLTSSFPGSTFDDTCGGKQQTRESWFGSVKNGATPFKLAAQVFGSFTIADTPADEEFGSGSFGRTTNK